MRYCESEFKLLIESPGILIRNWRNIHNIFLALLLQKESTSFDVQ